MGPAGRICDADVVAQSGNDTTTLMVLDGPECTYAGPWDGAPLVENPTFATSSKVRVRATTLDAFVEEQGIDHVRLLKLDLEGAETDALLGAARLLERRAVDYVLVESDLYRLRAFGHTSMELDAILTSAGYVAERIIDSEKILPVTSQRRLPGSFSGDHLYARLATWHGGRQNGERPRGPRGRVRNSTGPIRRSDGPGGISTSGLGALGTSFTTSSKAKTRKGERSGM
jgi:hypothetical protein